MECKPWEMDEGMSLIMMRMRRSLRTVLREAVLEEGLTPNEIEVLLFLEHGTYNTARDISRLRGMPRSLVSKAVDQLVRRGYVESSQDKQDRRVSRLQLLPASQSVVQRLAQARGDFLSKLCKGVTQEEFAAFFSMVEKMVANLGDMPLEDELRLENEFEKGSVKGQ